MQLMTQPLGPDERPEDRIRDKHKEYYAASKRFRALYYATRLLGGLCAGVLPFVVYSSPPVATVLAITIVVVTVFDTVFNPKDRWRTTSRASDLLFIADVKKKGNYAELEEALNIILSTEDQQMLQLLGLDEVIHKAKTTAENAAAESKPQKPKQG